MVESCTFIYFLIGNDVRAAHLSSRNECQGTYLEDKLYIYCQMMVGNVHNYKWSLLESCTIFWIGNDVKAAHLSSRNECQGTYLEDKLYIYCQMMVGNMHNYKWS